MEKELPENGPGLIAIILMAIAIMVLAWFLTNDNKKENSNINQEEGNPIISTNVDNKTNVDNTSLWNGIYTDEDGNAFKIYQKSDAEALINGQGSYVLVTPAVITNNKLITEEYEFTLNNGTLIISLNGGTAETSILGSYTKQSNYTKEEYYNDNIGNINYLNDTTWSGIYKLGERIAKVYQLSETEVRVSVNGGPNDGLGMSAYIYTINNDKLIYQGIFDDSNDVIIEKQENSLLITDNSSDVDSNITGTYTFDRVITIDDVIE